MKQEFLVKSPRISSEYLIFLFTNFLRAPIPIIIDQQQMVTNIYFDSISIIGVI